MVGDQTNRYQAQPEGWRNGLAGRLERFPLMVKDISTYGLDMHREQFFVRVSSSSPLLPMLEKPHFQEFLQSLAPLRIFTGPGSNTAEAPPLP